MEYLIDEDLLLEGVKEEVARAASREFSDDGTSLYDAIWPKSSDENILRSLMTESFFAILSRFRLADVKLSMDGLVFNVPDMSPEMQNAATLALDRTIILSVCAGWMGKAYPKLQEKYAADASVAMDKAVNIMYSRKMLERP